MKTTFLLNIESQDDITPNELGAMLQGIIEVGQAGANPAVRDLKIEIERYPANPTLVIGEKTIVNPTEEDFEEAFGYPETQLEHARRLS